MSIEAELTHLFPRIVHVHLKDLLDDEFVGLGTGSLPVESFLRLLFEMKYSGWITIELDSSKDALASARSSLEWLHRTLEKIGQ